MLPFERVRIPLFFSDLEGCRILRRAHGLCDGSVLCSSLQTFEDSRFGSEKPNNSETTPSPRAMCVHVAGAAHRYAHYIRKRRGIDFIERLLERW